MMLNTKSRILLFAALLTATLTHAQEKTIKDTTIVSINDTTPLSVKKAISFNRYDSANKAHSPRTAAIRSAILPGWGQIYNKKYWKLPIVYGGLGITGYIFFDNITTYREYRFAYSARYKAAAPFYDSTDYRTLKNIYKIYSPESIRTARNKFRQYIDYSVLVFILLWGINVVDATVDAHLKSFDVSPDLSLHFRAGYSEVARTNGISLVLKIGK